MNEFLINGFYGYYNKVYAQTIFLSKKSDNKLINYFTIISAVEEINGCEPKCHKFGDLNNDYSFGLYQRIKDFQWLESFKGQLECNNFYSEDSKKIYLGNVKLIQKQFVSCENERGPNKLTIGKFSSYIWEFFDVDKALIREVINLSELIKKVNSKVIPLGIDLSENEERIGNVIIEFPNNLIIDTKRINDSDLKIIWDDRLNSKLETKCILTQASYSYDETEIVDLIDDTIYFSDKNKFQKFKLINTKHNLILLEGRNCKGLTIEYSIARHLGVKRILTKSKHEIEITKAPGYGVDGDPIDEIQLCISKYRKKREIRKDIKNLIYKQYGKSLDGENKECRHQSALNDIHFLINKYGGKGFYLWDPYLSANDIIEIVINKFETTALVKALCSRKAFQSGFSEKNGAKDDSTKRISWIEIQKNTLENSSNHAGLNLEFRCAHTIQESSFHDRFIIFPNVNIQGEVKVWSLGISLNQYGLEHHILHEVDFPEYILSAFENIWNLLSDVQHLVFKKTYPM